MKNIIVISIIMISLVNQKVYSQISFLGFDKAPCGIIENKTITYQNYFPMCDSHSGGYKIFSDGVMIFEKCVALSGRSILDLKFVTENIGFLVEGSGSGTSILKTINAGKNWVAIGGGAPTYLGFYIINQNTGYLVTTYNAIIYITRVSDINGKFMSDSKIKDDIILNDTISGVPFCDIKSLSFKIKNSTDTINYKIILNDLPLSIDNFNNTSLSFYPNPASDYIQITGTTNECKIRILDSNGRLIKSFNKNIAELYVGDLKPGLYVMELTGKNERRISKFIKE